MIMCGPPLVASNGRAALKIRSNSAALLAIRSFAIIATLALASQRKSAAMAHGKASKASV